MNKALYLSIACMALLHASDVAMDVIDVEATVLEDVSGDEVKSADLAEALTQKISNISLVRRSGIANDIILRGQKKDNINVVVDGGKIYGGCPNRMDPPTSHIMTNNISGIKIIEGPYDVENFGTLSGGVYVTTKKPTRDISGEVSVNIGSWNYKKVSAGISGGTDRMRLLLSASTESSDQYEDGNGNNFAQQMNDYVVHHLALAGTLYQDKYSNLDAYDKRSLMGKVYIDITDDQELELSYTANRSNDVLYPSSKMDALYDDSDLFNAKYTLSHLSDYSKEFSILGYYSYVEHPMSTKYRKMAVSEAAAMTGAVTSYLESSIAGIKVKNIMDISDDTEWRVGIDMSRRNWDGRYHSQTGRGPEGKPNIDDVNTDNIGMFTELQKRYDMLDVTVGVRYDATKITTAGTQPDNDYSRFNANVFATYNVGESLRLFGGLGQSSRVPDPKELYFQSSMGGLIGTPHLHDTINREIDLGVENQYENVTLRTKIFYSMLRDYIYYNASKMLNRYENVDATVYGFDISGSIYGTDEFYVDFGVAYQRGKKEDPLSAQTDIDMAEIPPLKANIAFNYEYAEDSKITLETFGATAWEDYDAQNGEQPLDSYMVVNVKVDHSFGNGFSLAAGVDNIFDRTYAVSNTYSDLTLITDGTTKEVMLMNEPGRYLYANATYRF